MREFLFSLLFLSLWNEVQSNPACSFICKERICLVNGDKIQCVDTHPCDLVNCHSEATCYLNGFNPQCTCKTGFVGNGFTCTDPCNSGPCHTNATCSVSGSTVQCTCDSDLIGDGFNSCIVDTCDADPCHMNATCSVNGTAADCSCNDDLIGDGIANCFVDPCDADPCHMNATCSVNGTAADCSCNTGLIGDGINNCIVDPCDADPCHMNATCSLKPDGITHQCICNDDLVGDGVYSCKVSPHDAVEIECSDTDMTINILNSAYDNVTFTLQDTGCEFTNNGTHNTISITYDTCNTNLTETTDYLIYRNKAETKTNPGAIISRDPDHYVEILCKLERDATVTSSQLNVTNFDSINITKDDTTTFTLNLDVYPTSAYTGSPYTPTDYPLSLKIRDDINIALGLITSNNDVKLIPQNCYGTPTSNPSDATKHYFINQRCDNSDSTYKQIELTPKSFKFNFKAFKFLTTNDVFIHCQVAICSNTSSASECSLGCYRKRRDVNNLSKKGVQNENIEQYMLSSRQIVLDDQGNSSATENSSLTTKTIITASLGIGLVVIVVIVFAILIVCRLKGAGSGKNESQDKNIEIVA